MNKERNESLGSEVKVLIYTGWITNKSIVWHRELDSVFCGEA